MTYIPVQFVKKQFTLPTQDKSITDQSTEVFHPIFTNAPITTFAAAVITDSLQLAQTLTTQYPTLPANAAASAQISMPSSTTVQSVEASSSQASGQTANSGTGSTNKSWGLYACAAGGLILFIVILFFATYRLWKPHKKNTKDDEDDLEPNLKPLSKEV